MQITVTNLRKIFTEQGVKGASSWKREDFNSATIAAEFAAYAEATERRIAADNAAQNALVEAGNAAPVLPKTGRSRRGMVIIAKGDEVHKSETFRAAAEAAGWTVTVSRESYEIVVEDDLEFDSEGTRFYADAHRGDEAIQLAWDGKAYDYPASSARLAGKDRKVRNLKEALRLL
jgi:hypothetical protein